MWGGWRKTKGFAVCWNTGSRYLRLTVFIFMEPGRWKAWFGNKRRRIPASGPWVSGNQAAIIEEGVTGYRYAPEDAREFAEKLEKIRRENPRLKQNCREHYERNYTSEKNYALLMDIYRRLGACGK